MPFQNNALSSRRSRKTAHAVTRQLQRSIPQIIIDLLQLHADPVPAGGSAEMYRFDKKTWRYAAADLGRQAKYFERYRNAYIVQSVDGFVITVGWKH